MRNMLSRNRRNERRKTHLRSCLQPRKRLSLCLPLQGSGDILFFPLRTSLGLSVCVSVYLSVTKSCPLYNLITVTDISTKLHTFVNHIRRRVMHKNHNFVFGYFWSYFPLIICNAISCPLCKLTTIKVI